LLFAGTSSFTYDANGNQTSKTQTATGQPIVYSYDAANRLASVAGGIFNSSFTYDGDGNRISQSVGTGIYNYLNDVATALPVVLQESGPDGNISYAYGLGLISESSSAFDFFYHYDGLGSVAGLTDPSGKLAGRYVYDAWGQTDLSVPDTQIGTKNKFRFTGEALDPATQLYYLRARYYDPSVGRFLVQDLLPGFARLVLSRNRYIYALSNPIRNVDRAGLASEPVQGGQVGSQVPAPTSVNPPTTGSTLWNQARCIGVPFCSTMNSLITLDKNISQIQTQEVQDPQFQAVVNSCIGQVGSNIGGGPQTTGGVRQCVQRSYPYIGPRSSDPLLSNNSICSDARSQGVALTDCPKQ